MIGLTEEVRGAYILGKFKLLHPTRALGWV